MNLRVICQMVDERRRGTDEELRRLHAAGPWGSKAYWREAKRQSRSRKKAQSEMSGVDIDAVHYKRAAQSN